MEPVISLTTIPARIDFIEPCITSLLKQGLPVYLWLVEVLKRTGDKLGAIPDFIKNSGVHYKIVDDKGPITKLLPALEAGFEQVITADDDVIYGEDWAADLIEWSNLLPTYALGYRGRILKDNKYQNSVLVGRRTKKPTQVDLLTGVHGAFYRSKYFAGSGIFELWKKWPLNDDLVIAKALADKGVSLYVVPSVCKIKVYKVQHLSPLSNVNRINNDGPNNEGMKKLGLV